MDSRPNCPSNITLMDYILGYPAKCPSCRHDILEDADRAGVNGMPRTRTSIEKIRAELAWVNEPLDPNRCSCRHLTCCEEMGHAAGACTRAVEATIWKYRLEYYCSACREYELSTT